MVAFPLDSATCPTHQNQKHNHECPFTMNPGVLYAALAYTAWGLFPAFFKQLGNVNAFEVVMHRMVLSVVAISHFRSPADEF